MTGMHIESTDAPEAVAAALKGPATPPEKETPPAAPEEGETAPDSATEDKGKEGKPSDPAETTKVDKKIDQLVKGKTEAERERDLWKKAALEGGKKPTDAESEGEQPPAATGPKLRPKADDFQTHEAFEDALIEWKAEQIVEKRFAAADEVKKKEAEELKAKETFKTFEDKKKEAATRYDDFEEVTTGVDFPVSKVMYDTLMESSVSGDMAYYLCKNPEKAKEINAMSPLAAARELGKIEALLEEQLSAEDEEQPAPKPAAKPVVRNKPKPLSPVEGGTGKGVKTYTSADDLPFPEWEKVREKEIQQKRTNRL